MCWQKLQQELEFLEVQEEYIKDEQKNLKKEFLHAQEEVKRIQSIPLVIGQFLEAVDQNTAIVGSTTGNTGKEFRGITFLLTCWKALMDPPRSHRALPESAPNATSAGCRSDKKFGIVFTSCI